MGEMFPTVTAKQGDRQVEALQYTGENRYMLANWTSQYIREARPGVLELKTPHGVVMLHPGDWVIFSSKSFLPVTEATFNNCYEVLN